MLRRLTGSVFVILAWLCGPIPDSHAAFTLQLSLSSARTNPTPLAGTAVSGAIYVFVSPEAGVSQVRYWIDNPQMTGTPRQTENSAPWDFAGGTVTLARPFSTTVIADGSHTITAAVTLSAGGTQVVSATFTVTNGAAALAWSPDPITLSVLAGETTSTQVNLNSTIGTAAFTVTESAPWLTVSPTTGSTPASITLAANAAGLAAGTYAATVTATAPGNLGDTLAVTLQVADVVPPPPPPPAGTVVSIQGADFYLNGVLSYLGQPAEGLLMNARMVNSVFEDASGLKPSFNPETNTDEFLATMPDYVAHGIRAFSVCLQGGYPGYEGAVNTAFRSDGSLKPTYLARVKRVIQRADALGAVVILALYYQRQDQHLANEAAVNAGVVNVMTWLRNEGFGNVLVEIANEYPHTGFDHSIIKTVGGIVSLIRLAKATAPEFAVSASGYGNGTLAAEVANASDYLLIHTNQVGSLYFGKVINGFKGYGKPIVISEDPKSGSTGASAARAAVQNGASWGLNLRKNQIYPFVFEGAADDLLVYDAIRSLTE